MNTTFGPRGICLLAAALLLAPSAARAESLVICDVGGPGTTVQAQKTLDSFLRHMEKSAGIAAGSLSGEYHSTLEGCVAFVKKANPVLGVFDPVTYLQQSTALGLRPLAHMGKADRKRFHLLVAKGKAEKPEDLKGKTLISVVADPVFLSRIVFSGRLDVKDFKKLKVTERPLKALREVARGKQDAAVVDGHAFDARGEQKLDAELVSLQASEGMPALTLAVLGVNAKGKDDLVKKTMQSLSKLCTGEGKKMCDTSGTAAFEKADSALYQKLEKQYQGK